MTVNELYLLCVGCSPAPFKTFSCLFSYSAVIITSQIMLTKFMRTPPVRVIDEMKVSCSIPQWVQLTPASLLCCLEQLKWLVRRGGALLHTRGRARKHTLNQWHFNLTYFYLFFVKHSAMVFSELLYSFKMYIVRVQFGSRYRDRRNHFAYSIIAWHLDQSGFLTNFNILLLT